MLSKVSFIVLIVFISALFPIKACAQIAEIRVGLSQFDERILDIAFAAQAGDETSAAIHGEILFEEPEFLKWALSPQPYIGGTINLEGNTSYGGAGFLWRQTFGPRFYASIASGGVLRTGTNDLVTELFLSEERDIIFGSRFLFRQQGALGVNLTKDWAAEVFFEHLSNAGLGFSNDCLLYTSPSPRDGLLSRMPSSA